MTSLDLGSRLLLWRHFYYRPEDRFVRTYPPLPLLLRFDQDVHSVGQVYGDLAAMAANEKFRENRTIEFFTDNHGFRNDRANDPNLADGLDLIVLGDSFGMGSGTSQRDTIAPLLAREHHLATYNLSLPAGPWQEFMNLSVASDWLQLKPGRTVVLWMIFSGNDLDDPCYPTFDKARLLDTNAVHESFVELQNFRARSLVHKLLYPPSSGGSHEVIAAPFLDGRTMLFYAVYARRAPRTYHEVKRHPNYRCLETTMHAMRQLADAKNLTIDVILAPSKEEVYSWVLNGGRPWSTSPSPSGLSQALQEICQREGMSFLDLKPLLVVRSQLIFLEKRELLWWRDDSHWNSTGHRAVAEIIYEKLRDRHDLSRAASADSH